jgi:hypothetical protein
MTKTMNLLLAGAFTLALAAPAVHTSAPEGGWVGFDQVPDRSSSLDFSQYDAQVRDLGCTPTPDRSGLQDRVVIFEDGDIERRSFASLQHASRYWTLGSC